jgi:hypothetical protein
VQSRQRDSGRESFRVTGIVGFLVAKVGALVGSDKPEDELPTVRRLCSVRLGDDVSKDVIPFHDRSINAVVVRSARDRKPGQHR